MTTTDLTRGGDMTGDRPALLAALRAAAGYLLNAKIDLETGCPKRTAVKTIEGGLNVVNAAIEAAMTAPPVDASAAHREAND